MVELWAPGHAVSGIIGLACLLLFAFGHYVVNLAGWETLLLFGAGATLVLLEIFFFPGHGVMVVLGVVLAMLALTESMVDLKRVPLDVSWAAGWLPRALTRAFGSLLAAGATLAFLSRYLPRSRLGRALILKDAIGAHGGMTATSTAPATLLHREGVAETALRPTGKAVIEGRRVRRGQRRRLHRAGNRGRGRRGRGHADRRAKESDRLIVNPAGQTAHRETPWTLAKS